MVSFPGLTIGFGIPERIANATNSVGLWPGSLAGGLGFRNLFEKTGGYLRILFLPTILGSLAGALLLLNTSNGDFKNIIPVLVLLAAVLLLLQKRMKGLIGKGKQLPLPWGIGLQFLVSFYGGYFGAGMGIMMLACFALYIEGNVHELNAVKNWLSLIVNFACSSVFIFEGLVRFWPALYLVLGALVGGFVAARVSQRFDPDKLRLVIAVYGFGMAAFFAYRAYW